MKLKTVGMIFLLIGLAAMLTQLGRLSEEYKLAKAIEDSWAAARAMGVRIPRVSLSPLVPIVDMGLIVGFAALALGAVLGASGAILAKSREANMIPCPNCFELNERQDEVFSCKKCGRKIHPVAQAACPNCRNPAAVNFAVCPQCGTKMR